MIMGVKMVKITVFTRAYNTEKYIEQCIQSILNQTFHDFEYIIVDNGSTDKTKNIIEKYSQIDKRIKRIRLEKNRTGVLQDILDKGIEGKYFVTLDSDDWYEPDFLEFLYDFAERYDLDISACGSKLLCMSGGNIGYRKLEKGIILEKNKFANYFRFYHVFFRTTWAKLFKTEIIMKSDFEDLSKNNEGLGYGSDTLFSMAILSASNKIGISDRVMHNYRVHDKSVSYSYNEKRIHSDILLFENSEKFLKKFGQISSENYYFIYLVYLNAIKDTLNTLLKSSLKKPDIIYELNKILKQPLTRRMFSYMRNDKNLIDLKKQLINIIVKLGQTEMKNSNVINLAFDSICLLFEQAKEYINADEFEKHIKNPYYMLYMLDVDKKGMFLNNILLNWIKDENFIFKYHKIIKDICNEDLNAGLDKILILLSEDNETKFYEELIIMCLNLSASLEDGAVFIYAKKLQAKLFTYEGRFEEAKAAIYDLTEMCPDDEDVVMLKKCLEEDYD